MVKLNTLIEQTSFLIDKQKDAMQDCIEMFNDLLSTVDAQMKKAPKNSELAENLTQVSDLIGEQLKLIKEDAQGDIDFLKEQLEALQSIKAVDDPKKAKALLEAIIDEDEEIKDTAVFKKEVTEESVASRQGLATMINDIKDAIKEGNAKEVVLYLESILSADNEGSEDEDDVKDLIFGLDEEDDEEEAEDSCCKSCSGCKGKKGCN